MITEFLHRPYPFTSTRRKFLTPLAFAVFISLFLFVFQPFGLSRVNSKPMALIAAGYGVVTFLVVFAEMWVLPLLFPAYFNESRWTVGREIAVVVLDVFLIGLCNLLYSAWALELELSFRAAVWYQAVTVIIAILPLTIWVMYKQLRLQKRYMAEAKVIDTHVQERLAAAGETMDARRVQGEKVMNKNVARGQANDGKGLKQERAYRNAVNEEAMKYENENEVNEEVVKETKEHEDEMNEAFLKEKAVNEKDLKGKPLPTVTIPAEQAGEPLLLTPDQLLYIAAADNYIKVYHLERGLVKQTLLRSSLKKVAAGLKDHPRFFRCHRTFLVNLDHVTEVRGNAQGYKLQLAYTGDWVPVSRSLHDEIRQKL